MKKLLVLLLSLSLVFSLSGCGLLGLDEEFWEDDTFGEESSGFSVSDGSETLGDLFDDGSSADPSKTTGTIEAMPLNDPDIDAALEEMSTFTIQGEYAYMSGVTTADTIRQINILVNDYPDVTTIIFESVEGTYDDNSNIEVCRVIRNSGLNTYLPSTGEVASGGVDLLIAGVERTVENGGKVGVHSWSDGTIDNALELGSDHPEHQLYIDFYTEMTLPDPSGFYYFTLNQADADDMYYMTHDELVQYGVITY